MERSTLNKLRLFVNRLLAPSGFEIGRRTVGEVGLMEGAITRLPELGFEFGSVIDIGAAAGSWTSMSSSILTGPMFLMVEALREREPVLRALVSTDPSRLKYQVCAVGPCSGSTSFSVTADLDGSGVSGEGNQGPVEVRTVEMRTLDQLAVAHSLKPPYLVKFDTHGFEVPILNGAPNLLKLTDVIVMECYFLEGPNRTVMFWKMCHIMDTIGFRCFDIVDQLYRPTDGRLWQVDLLFARKEWHGFRPQNWS